MGICINNRTQEAVIMCDCGCDDGIAIKIDRDLNDSMRGNTIYFFSIVTSAWYHEQENMLTRIRTKIKRLWYVLANKEFNYCEVMLNQKDYNELIDYLIANKDTTYEEKYGRP